MHPAAPCVISFFFLNDPATPEISPLPLHDALPICHETIAAMQDRTHSLQAASVASTAPAPTPAQAAPTAQETRRSEEHTSELQSHLNLVCRLLLEKKKKTTTMSDTSGISWREF